MRPTTNLAGPKSNSIGSIAVEEILGLVLALLQVNASAIQNLAPLWEG